MSSEGATLAFTRPLKSKAQRRQELDAVRQTLDERRELFDDFRAHARTLRQYFITLEAVATSDEPLKYADATHATISALEGLHPKLAGAAIGAAPLGDVIPAIAELVVDQALAAKVGQRLRADYKTVLRGLDLQEQALILLSERIEEDRDTARTLFRRHEVREPYAAEGPLPKNWDQAWASSFERAPAVEAFFIAAQAIRELRQNYADFITGEVSLDTTRFLLADIEKIVAILERVKGN